MASCFCSHMVQVAIGALTSDGWQNSLLKRAGISIGLVGLTTGSTGAAGLFPWTHWQVAGQVVAESWEKHFWMMLISLVMSIGAQKSKSGISSLPSDQVQP